MYRSMPTPKPITVRHFSCMGHLDSALEYRKKRVNRDIDRMEKSIKSINGKVDSLYVPSTEEIRKEMNETMFNFLIYEDDFDKGKASLSDIKSKINTQK